MNDRATQLLVAFLLLTGCVVHGQQFQVEGHLVYSIRPDQSNGDIVSKDFLVKVSGCSSFYRSYDLRRNYAIEIGVDGENVYYAGRFPPGQEAQTNLPAGFVERRKFPRDDSSNINYLWLAFGSACYFDSVTNDLVDPIWLLDNWTIPGAEYQERAIFTRVPAERLPRSLVYLADGYYHAVDTSRKPLTALLPPPFDKGFTNAVYEVLESTNFSGVFVPLKFKFTRYGILNQGSGKAQLVRTTETIAEVTKLEPLHSEEALKPAFDGPHWVVDSRFQSRTTAGGHFAYILTNENWKSTPDAEREYWRQSENPRNAESGATLR